MIQYQMHVQEGGATQFFKVLSDGKFYRVDVEGEVTEQIKEMVINAFDNAQKVLDGDPNFELAQETK